MIDIHCHILPGIDDGPESIEESIAMCRIARADGIDTIVATPHVRPGLDQSGDIAARLRQLQDELDRLGIAMTILRGADVAVTPELRCHLKEDRTLFINGTGKFFLAELPHVAVPASWDRFLLSFRSAGSTPIITHPERNRWFLNHPEALYPFVSGGGLVQITAMSVTGNNGPEARAYCEYLLRHDLAHVIATDAHSTDLRPPVLSDAVRAAAGIIGSDAANRLVRDTPLAVIEGGVISAPEPSLYAARKRKWYHRLLDL